MCGSIIKQLWENKARGKERKRERERGRGERGKPGENSNHCLTSLPLCHFLPIANRNDWFEHKRFVVLFFLKMFARWFCYTLIGKWWNEVQRWMEPIQLPLTTRLSCCKCHRRWRERWWQWRKSRLWSENGGRCSAEIVGQYFDKHAHDTSGSATARRRFALRLFWVHRLSHEIRSNYRNVFSRNSTVFCKFSRLVDLIVIRSVFVLRWWRNAFKIKIKLFVEVVRQKLIIAALQVIATCPWEVSHVANNIYVIERCHNHRPCSCCRFSSLEADCWWWWWALTSETRNVCWRIKFSFFLSCFLSCQ